MPETSVATATAALTADDCIAGAKLAGRVPLCKKRLCAAGAWHPILQIGEPSVRVPQPLLGGAEELRDTGVQVLWRTPGQILAELCTRVCGTTQSPESSWPSLGGGTRQLLGARLSQLPRWSAGSAPCGIERLRNVGGVDKLDLCRVAKPTEVALDRPTSEGISAATLPMFALLVPAVPRLSIKGDWLGEVPVVWVVLLKRSKLSELFGLSNGTAAREHCC